MNIFGSFQIGSGCNTQLSTTLNTSTVLRTSAVSAAVLQAKEAAVAGAAMGHELGPFFGLPSAVKELLHKHRGINGLYGGPTFNS
jgi:Asp-tRNA(Asn)/Glu-tRNA(Gln) amidotransferase A subunit family amidase